MEEKTKLNIKITLVVLLLGPLIFIEFFLALTYLISLLNIIKPNIVFFLMFISFSISSIFSIIVCSKLIKKLQNNFNLNITDKFYSILFLIFLLHVFLFIVSAIISFGGNLENFHYLIFIPIIFILSIIKYFLNDGPKLNPVLNEEKNINFYEKYINKFSNLIIITIFIPILLVAIFIIIWIIITFIKIFLNYKF